MFKRIFSFDAREGVPFIMISKSQLPLGQLLIRKGIITAAQLDSALQRQSESSARLGAILLSLGLVEDESVFLPLVADQENVEYVQLKNIDISDEAVRKIPAKFVSHYKVMPVRWVNDTLTIATPSPLDIHMQDEISAFTDVKLNPVLAGEKDILGAIRKYYGLGAETIEKMMGNIRLVNRMQEDIAEIEATGSDASISKFLNQILLEAYRDRATDIHIEPYEDELQIRYRIDGMLYDAKVPANIKHFKEAINSRIKILSNLNIAEKRMPQDGRFKVRVDQVDLDLRVSFMPTPYGESVVLRLLNTSRLYDFEKLGLEENERSLLEKLIRKPHGIIFLTGPTGSGKTTTLYACLSRVKEGDKKILTIEDPIEYQLKGITQIQVNPSIQLTFAKGLRSMLRHDPDIMMVGEVRDKETAEIAIQVALTGHLVFSTLHTNDATGGVARLLDMGIAPYLISSTVECFIAQRLVRLICPKCKKPIPNARDIYKDFALEFNDDSGVVIFKGEGCKACYFTGYAGRQAVYEFLVLDEIIRDLIIKRASVQEIKAQAIRKGMKTLRQAGWLKIRQGLTTPEEVTRVTQDN